MTFMASALLAVSLLGAAPHSTHQATYVTGFAAYSEGDFESAIRIWQRLAERGQPEAQYAMGVLYELGHGVPHNYQIAAHWYLKAAKQHYAMAKNNLGMLHEGGYGVPQNDATAVNYYRESAMQGLPSAQYNLALMHYQGTGVEQSFTVASTWMLRSAQQGFASAQYNLGIMYQRGEGVPHDDVAAAQWYIEAVKWGAPRAEANLQSLLQDKNRVVATQAVVVRQQPQNSASAVAEIGVGAGFYALRREGSWLAVLLEDQRILGWIDTAK